MLPPVLIELKFIFSTFLHKAHHKYSVPTGQLHKSDSRADPYFAGLMLLLLNCYGKYGMCPAHHQILHQLSLIWSLALKKSINNHINPVFFDILSVLWYKIKLLKDTNHWSTTQSHPRFQFTTQIKEFYPCRCITFLAAVH